MEQDEAVEHERRRDAEIDEIGEGIELGAEARGALEQARHPPVDAVEGGRDQDGEDGRLETSLEGKADGRQAEAERDQGDHVRGDDAERHRLEQAPARLHRIGRERGKQVAHCGETRAIDGDRTQGVIDSKKLSMMSFRSRRPLRLMLRTCRCHREAPNLGGAAPPRRGGRPRRSRRRSPPGRRRRGAARSPADRRRRASRSGSGRSARRRRARRPS